MTILILGVDFDDCLYNQRYYQLYLSGDHKGNNSKALVLANEQLINRWVAQINSGGYEAVYLAVMSSRQNDYYDHISNEETGSASCFESIMYLRQYLQNLCPNIFIEVQPLVMQTVFHHRTTPFFPDQSAEFHPIDFDTHKASLIYMHSHSLAAKFPDRDFEFHHYDDNVKILAKLNHYYQQTANGNKLLPNDLRLIGYCYSGDSAELCYKVDGTGSIDRQYSKTLRAISELLRKSERFECRHENSYWYNMAELLTASDLLSLRGESVADCLDTVAAERRFVI